MIPSTWIQSSKVSRKITTKKSSWYKILQRRSRFQPYCETTKSASFAAEIFNGDKKLTAAQIPTFSKDPAEEFTK